MPLTERGRSQAAQAAEKLLNRGIVKIYLSPLQRANETGRIIGKRIGVDDFEVIDDLIEREFGVLTGKPKEDIPRLGSGLIQTEKILYFLEAEGAEDFPTLYERAKQVLGQVHQQHPKENVLLATHGDVGKMMQAVHRGWDWETGLRQPYFDNTSFYELTFEE